MNKIFHELCYLTLQCSGSTCLQLCYLLNNCRGILTKNNIIMYILDLAGQLTMNFILMMIFYTLVHNEYLLYMYTVLSFTDYFMYVYYSYILLPV